MQRYIVIDPLKEFYSLPENADHDYDDFKEQHGPMAVAINKVLTTEYPGFTENTEADVTGGDHDFVVVDTLKKEWCWWENGFAPFCLWPEELPHHREDRDLVYWADHRS